MKLELNTEQLELLEFILSEFEYEDLFDVHTVLEETKNKYEQKLAKARAKQPTPQWD